MQYSGRGYMGKYLRVDLTTSAFSEVELESGFVRNFIGGTGFGAKILYDELSKDTDPLSPENKLVIATGPSTGTGYPASGRFSVMAKSPLTGIWGEANSGGFFGPEFKQTGYDMLVISGRAPKPSYIAIDDGKVEIRSAEHLWGKTITPTTEMILEEWGDPNVRVACIGPSGEQKVRFAAIMNDFHRAAGRTGMGAVMGSKNLKAIAVRGTKDIEIKDPDEFREAMDRAIELLHTGQNGEFSETLGKYGTPSLVSSINEIGRFPTRNHLTGFFERAEDLDEFKLLKEYRTHRGSCFGCSLQCKYLAKPRSKFKDSISGPEYETIMAFGSNCLNADMDSVVHANYLCNEYGLDTISTGCVVAFVLECYQNSLLPFEITEDLDLTWGNDQAIVDLTLKIAKREGALGNLLAEGTKIASERIGGLAQHFAIHVKGLEVSGQDPRAQYSVAITHGTNVRGADHLRSLSCLEELGFPDIAVERFGKEKADEIMTLTSPKYKAEVVADMEKLYALCDSLITCKYGVMWPPSLYYREFADAMRSLTGLRVFGDVSIVKTAGHRICVQRKLFNVREGLRRKDDTLPERMFRDAMTSGPSKGRVVPKDVYDGMLDEYYDWMGYNRETSVPKPETLRVLGLEG